MGYIKLYTSSSPADSAYYLNDGRVYFFVSNDDKYSINGKNLIVGATELIMRHMLGILTERIETAVTDSISKVKKMPVDKFISGMNSFSFNLNVSMVLARQVLLTNGIINRNINHLEGDEKKNREVTVQFYMIINRLRDEYDKRKLTWLKELIREFETSLSYKRGEAYHRSSEPVKITTADSLSDKEVEYSTGSIICEEDTRGEEMYILQSGAIDVYIKDNRVASINEPGTVIGEMALLLGEKRTATLKAKNNVVITTIKKSDLKEIAEKQIELLHAISFSLARRHYYNIIKIGEINRSIIEKTIDIEAGEGPKTAQIHKSMKELAVLKRKIEDTARKKDCGFIQDLIDGF